MQALEAALFGISFKKENDDNALHSLFFFKKKKKDLPVPESQSLVQPCALLPSFLQASRSITPAPSSAHPNPFLIPSSSWVP